MRGSQKVPSPNALCSKVIGNLCDDRCVMSLPDLAPLRGRGSPKNTVGQIGRTNCTATFAISGRSGRAFSLLQLQSCSNHHTCKGDALSLLLTGQGG